MKTFTSGAFFLLLCISGYGQTDRLSEGHWYGKLLRRDSIAIPFQLEISYDHQQQPILTLLNADERLEAVTIYSDKDSVAFRLAYFGTELKAHILSSKHIQGIWTDENREDMWLGFTAEKKAAPINSSVTNIHPKYSAIFRPGEPNSFPAILQIRDKNDALQATFRTPSGDFRYLNGYIQHDTLVLYKFDGIVSYLIKARINGDQLSDGVMYSGAEGFLRWQAQADDSATFNNPYDQTRIISNAPLSIKARSLNGDTVVIDRQSLAGKVSLITIMGTWCPNCLDEARHLVQLTETYPDLHILGLSFERPKEWPKIRALLEKYAGAIGISYPIFYAGPANSTFASGLFPMLDGIKAFPTLIVVNKAGIITQVLTGYDGPATGEASGEYEKKLRAIIETLSEE